jgi:uncharacterized protein (TIGR00251 family)
MELEVRIQPRARRNELVGGRDGVLLARVTAPPVGGKANEALRKLLAKRVRVPPSRVTIVRGERAREKLIRIEGLADDDGRRMLDLEGGEPAT